MCACYHNTVLVWTSWLTSCDLGGLSPFLASDKAHINSKSVKVETVLTVNIKIMSMLCVQAVLLFYCSILKLKVHINEVFDGIKINIIISNSQ